MLTRHTISPFHTPACAAAPAEPPRSFFVAKRSLLDVSCATLLVVAATTSVFPPAAAAAEPAYVPGRLLIQHLAGLSDDEVDKALKPHGGKRVGKIDQINVHVVQLPPQANSKAEEAVAAALAKNKHFKFVERDQIVPLGGTTNDPSLASQWHLAKIGAPTAWDTTTGASIKVAIIDTGVDGSHPDLAQQLVPGWNFYDNNANSADVHGHGTAVAGAAAAAGNNGLGVASVAYGAKIMPLRVSYPDGSADWGTMAKALTWAADNGARVANLSYESVSGSSTINSAATYLKGKGGVTVVAAGNSGTNSDAVSYDDLVVVAATDSSDNRTSWSNYGSHIDVAAPGTSILTTTRGGGYGIWQGTSFSSPVVAGAVALMMAANPALSTSQIQSLLYSTAVDLGTAGKDIYYGAGRVNVAAASQAAAAATGGDTQSPTNVQITEPAGGTVSGLVAVNVNANDNVGVAKVVLLVNGTAYATDTTAPFGFSWDTTKSSSGTATLLAEAHDAAGNYTRSAPVTVNVSNTSSGSTTTADTSAPTAVIESPTSGAKVSGIVGIKASAKDNLGCDGITLSLDIDGKATVTTRGCRLNSSWNTRKAAVGEHTLSLTARDAAGNTTTTGIKVTK